MTRHNRYHRFFLSPDADTATLGGGIADVIPAAGTGPSVTEINLDSTPAIENSPAVKALEQIKDRTKSPEELGMRSAAEDSELMELTKPRARGADGKFLPKDEPGAPAAQPAKPQAPKPVAKAPTPAKPAQVKPAPAAVPPVVPAKAKEPADNPTAALEARLKELEAKLAKAEQPAPKAPEPTEPPKTAEEQAAAQKERENAFLTSARNNYLLPEANLDKILMGGAEGAQELANLIATGEMKSRQFAADQMQKMYDDLRAELAGLDPIRQSHSQVQELIAETTFLGANKDIAEHPQGLEIFRRLSNQMKEGYEDTKAKVAAGTATKSEQGWLLQYEDLTPEVLRDTIAGHTRTEMAKAPVAAAPVVAVAPPKPAAPKIVERPLGGDRPGAIGTPRTESHEASLARQIAERHQ